MSLYDFTTSYMQNPFVLQMPYTSTFQTSSFAMPSFYNYPSIFGNLPQSPILNTFNNTIFGYNLPPTSYYFGQTGMNNPFYNMFSYPISTMPYVYQLPAYNQNYNFGARTDNYGNGFNIHNRGTYYYDNSFRDFGSILTSPVRSTSSVSYTNPVSRQNPYKRYSNNNPSINRALELAVAELGTSEINGSNDSPGIRKYKNGAINNAPWCASFISWVYGAGQNSNNSKTFGYSTHSQDIRRQAQRAGFYSAKNSGYTPKPGDLMILKYSDNTGHVGIITKVNSNGSFETIEGNSGNKVKRVHRRMNDAKLDGFVKMDDWLKAA